MLKAAPEPVDVQDLQFKLRCRLKVFNSPATASLSQSCNLLACASRFGLVFIGNTTSSFQVVQLKHLENYEKADGDKADYPRRTISTLPSPPKYLSVNCEHTILGVVVERDSCPWVYFYDVKSFWSNNVVQCGQVRLSATPNVTVVDVSWNPALAAIFTACKSDGSLGVYELKNPGMDIKELPAQAGATCFCWSPKGKQIAVGSRDGKITQYKPDLKAVKVINEPPLKEPSALISLQWVSNYQFIGIFQPPQPGSFASLIVVDAPKTGDVIYTNYEDICYSNGSVRLSQFYMILIQTWNVLMVASSNSMEVGVLGGVGDKWTQWIMGDAARAELPLGADHQETLPIGFALDIGSTVPLPWGEGTLPPTPFLLLLSHCGTLCCFNIVNLKENIPSVCSPPENVADTSGLKDFIVEKNTEVEVKKPQAIENPPKPAIVQQPIKVSTQPATSLFGAGFKETPSSTAFPTFKIPNPQPPITTVSAAESTPPTPQLPKSTPPPEINSLNSSKASEDNNKAVAIVKSAQSEAEEEKIFSQMIRDELIYFESELKAALHESQHIPINAINESSALVARTDKLEEFFEEVVENCKTQTSDVHLLLQNVLQSWAWYEEAKSKFNASNDESMSVILRSEPLDSSSAKRLADIKHINYYLESQLAQANRVLDEQWDNFQDYCKKTYKIEIPTMEAIFQTMVKQQAIVQKQSYILKDIARRLKRNRSSLGASLLKSVSNIDAKSLEEDLKTLRLENDEVRKAQREHILNRTKNFGSEKQNDLLEFLQKQKVRNITECKTQLSSSILQLSPPKSTKQLSILGAKMSPVSKEPLARRIDFVQSTPKPTVKTEPTLTPIEGLQNFTMKFEANSFNMQQKNATIASSPNSAFVPTSLPLAASAIVTKPQSSPRITYPTFTPPVATAAPVLSSSTVNLTPATLITSLPSQPTSIASKPFSFASTSENTTTSKSTFGESATMPTTLKPFSFNAASTTSIFGSSDVKTVVSTPKLGIATTAVTASSLNLTSSKSTSSVPTTVSGSAFSFVSVTSTTTTPKSTSSVATSSTTAPTSTFSFGSLTSSSNGTPKATSSVTAVTTTTPASTFSFGSVTSTTATPKPSTVSITTGSAFSFASVTSSTGSIFGATVIPTTPTATSKPFSFASLANNSAISITPVARTTAPITTSAQPINLVTTPKVADQPQTPTTTNVTTSKPVVFGAVTTSSPRPVATTTTVAVKPTISSVTTSTVSTSAVTTTQFSFASSAPAAQTSSIFASATSTATTTAPSIFSSPSLSTIFATTTTTTPSSVFGSAQKPLFGTSTTSSGTSIFGGIAATTSQSTIFGGVSGVSVAATSSAPLFGSTATTTTQTIFGSSAVSATSSAPLFGTASTSQPTSVFGSATTAATSSVFGSPATTTSKPSLFGSFTPSSTSQSSVFGSASAVTTSTQNTTVFGAAISQQTPVFGATPTTTSSAPVFGGFGSPAAQTKPTGSIFGGGSSQFGAATSTNSQASSPFGSTQNTVFASPAAGTPASGFGAAAAATPPAFGQSPSVFGGQTTSTFGSPSTFGSSPSLFGTSTFGQSGSVFGGGAGTTTTSATTTSASSGIFGGGSSAFGAVSAASSPFGAASTSQSTTFGANTGSAFGFGGLNVGSATAATTTASFGTALANPFGTPTSQKSAFSSDTSKSIFGGATGGSTVFGSSNSSGSIFGSSNQTSAFGSTSTFGASSPQQTSIFGQQQQQQPAFGQSTFGSSGGFGQQAAGPFSGGGGSVAQSGFGAAASFQKPAGSGFGAAPVFGSSSFGSSPSFGGAPAFGSASTFGSPQKVFGSTGFGAAAAGATGSPQTAGFGNLANQPTVGFGNLAQQASTPPPASGNTFSGGSSFSSWR